MSYQTTWCWRLTSGSALLPSSDAIVIADRCRQALIRTYKRIFGQKLPNSFHHAAVGEQHAHAHYLPEDRDGDGFIDHVTIHSDNGIPVEVTRALQAITHIRYLGNDVGTELKYFGSTMNGRLFGEAHAWQSVSPFVTFKHRYDKSGRERPNLTIEHQLIHELKLRSLPPASVEWREECNGKHASCFVKKRKYHRPPPSDAVASFVKLKFDHPVKGPLCLGYGSHFGLGMCIQVV